MASVAYFVRMSSFIGIMWPYVYGANLCSRCAGSEPKPFGNMACRAVLRGAGNSASIGAEAERPSALPDGEGGTLSDMRIVLDIATSTCATRPISSKDDGHATRKKAS